VSDGGDIKLDQVPNEDCVLGNTAIEGVKPVAKVLGRRGGYDASRVA
jgi:hypothetical protein